ncbi:cyclic nucleotide-binding domain-containing protein [bacterium]|nr:cyclic nucleotide-binding domain-containing protein [bacterium]
MAKEKKMTKKEGPLSTGFLGRVYNDGQVIIHQGEEGDRMYEIQDGQVEVIQEKNGKEFRLAVLGKGDFFGEMAVFDREVRSATVRALGIVRAITIDKRTFLKKITRDPSLAFRIIESMSRRIRKVDAEIVRLRASE